MYCSPPTYQTLVQESVITDSTGDSWSKNMIYWGGLGLGTREGTGSMDMGEIGWKFQ